MARDVNSELNYLLEAKNPLPSIKFCLSQLSIQADHLRHDHKLNLCLKQHDGISDEDQ